MKIVLMLRGLARSSAIALLLLVGSAHLEATRIYVLLTPSHEQMFKRYFLPSLQDDYELVIRTMEQLCDSAAFMQKGWKQTVIKKVDMILDAIKKECGGEPTEAHGGAIFVYSDVDIQFFGKTWPVITEMMKDARVDIVIQKDHPKGTSCTGFFACRANSRTWHFWRKVRDLMAKNLDTNKPMGDQLAFNTAMKTEGKRLKINWKHLPTTFMGPGTVTAKSWLPGKKLPLPDGLIMHHANWTRGIDRKVAQLEYVRTEMLKRKKAV